MKKYLLAFLLLLNVAVFAQNLTHSVSQEITSGSVRCTNEFGGGNNTYLRFFKLEDFNITSDYSISNVEFGIWTVNGPTVLTVKLYATNEDFPQNFPGEGYTLLAQEEYEVSALQMMLFSAPVSAVVPYGKDLVVQVEYQTAEDIYTDFGSNGSGQTSPTYLMADLCEYLIPVDASTLDIPEPFNELSLVLNVVGEILSLNDNTIAGIRIFPNPANEYVKVQSDSELAILNAFVIDSAGKRITLSNKNGIVDFSGLVSGLYYLCVVTENGNITKKIIKE